MNKFISNIISEKFKHNIINGNNEFNLTSNSVSSKLIDAEIAGDKKINFFHYNDYTGTSPILNAVYENSYISWNIASESSLNNILAQTQYSKILRRLKDGFESDFLGILKENNFEFGYSSNAELFIRNCLKECATDTKQWLNEIFIENFHNAHISEGILRIISHFEYDEISPQGPTIALAALTHINSGVKECAVRAFENWGTLDCLRILESTGIEEIWLKNYIDDVIQDLREAWSINESTS